jgi:hypothetical protein
VAETLKELRSLPDEEIIRRHDKEAEFAGTEFSKLSSKIEGGEREKFNVRENRW